MRKTVFLNSVIFLITATLASAATCQSTPTVSSRYVPNEIIVKFHETIAEAVEKQLEFNTLPRGLKLSTNLDELNTRYQIKRIEPLFKNFKKNRQRSKTLLKKDKALLTKREKRILRRLRRAPRGTRVAELDRIYRIKVELEPGRSLEEVLAAYNNDPGVEYVELNDIVSINSTPNDPLYSYQWPLNNTGQMYPESGDYNPPPGTPDCDIDAPEAWNIETGNSEVIVAVVDTGVDYTHRDLDDNMWINVGEIPDNDIDDDENGYIDDIYGYDFCAYDGETRDSDPIDDHGHGTHCSGTIAAEGNNGLDIAGVCWDANIMALKFLDAGGNGHNSDAAVAFYYAVDNGADVISNSWGGGKYSETMELAIDYAYSQGVILVASAGNMGAGSCGYPARYEHVISVAATDSNDLKASFSNYGDEVDIAAPGVDILSLRARWASGATPYDAYTTIASGTSMAGPHISGACAFLLSMNPDLSSDDVNNILMQTVDPIAPEICQSGRLNLYNSMVAAVLSKGHITLDHDYYSCASVINIRLSDRDLVGQGTQEVIIATNGGDLETFFLNESTPAIGIFTGTILTISDNPNTEDGAMQVAHDQMITVTYDDANDGTGNPATVIDTATVDCQPPTILNIQFDQYPIGPEPVVTFETNEPTTARVLCGMECGEPNDVIATDLTLAVTHTIQLSGVFPETDYYFIVEITDAAGNETVDANNEQCYAFTTDSGPRDINVPSEYTTIQEAVDISWDGSKVWVADGTYTGQGNRDIDFRGKAITVQSANGPNNCIIDCNGTESEPHRGFYFVNYEDANSAVVGITVINGYAEQGGGISCKLSSPLIDNCVIKDCLADEGGGIYNKYSSSPTLNNCIFTGNSATDKGGGISNKYSSSPTVTNCTFTANSATNYGGGMYNFESNPTVITCTFNENSASGASGGGMHNASSNSTITNCTFIGNLSIGNGGGICSGGDGSPTISNCTFHNNSTQRDGGGVYNTSKPVITNCTFTDNEAISEGGDGGGICNGYSAGPTLLTNCTFIGNRAGRDGGGMLNDEESDTTVTNCRIMDNSSGRLGGGMANVYECTGTFTNCILSGNYSANSGGGVYNNDNNATFANCIISGNLADNNGGGMSNNGCATILTNCTLSGNSAGNSTGGIYNKGACYITLTNCILWDDTPNELYVESGIQTITYCDIQGSWPGLYNIDHAPGFVDPGYWDPNGTPSEPNDDFWLDGDYHLQSQAGRWNPNTSSWAMDDVNSPCIDAGDPNSDWSEELWPHGKRINMGAYGGTPQASMSLSDAGNIADLNNSDLVDYTDMMAIVNKWLYQEILLPEDLDRNGVVNIADFAIFANEWFWEE